MDEKRIATRQRVLKAGMRRPCTGSRVAHPDDDEGCRERRQDGAKQRPVQKGGPAPQAGNVGLEVGLRDIIVRDTVKELGPVNHSIAMNDATAVVAEGARPRYLRPAPAGCRRKYRVR
jgi:hypothetical protein